MQFSHKQVVLEPGKHPDKATQEKTIRKIVSEVLNTQYNNNVVLFMDPVHQTHNVTKWKCRQIVGRENTKTIESNTWRRRLNIVWAVDSNWEVTIDISEENCDQERIKRFLRQLREKYKDKTWICIYLDNARYQRAKAVQEYAKSLKIRLRFLPPYSPNLNLIERVWKRLKKKVTKNKYYATFEEFVSAIKSLFENMEAHEDDISKLINMKFQIVW